MKMRKTAATFVCLFFTAFNAFSQEQNVQLADVKSGSDPQHLIPVNVNWQNHSSLLEVQFTGPVQAVFVVVTGPDGVVYQNQVTTENAKSIYVDLKPYREGEYTIRFQDVYGNEVEGDFFKEVEEN